MTMAFSPSYQFVHMLILFNSLVDGLVRMPIALY